MTTQNADTKRGGVALQRLVRSDPSDGMQLVVIIYASWRKVKSEQQSIVVPRLVAGHEVERMTLYLRTETVFAEDLSEALDMATPLDGEIVLNTIRPNDRDSRSDESRPSKE